MISTSSPIIFIFHSPNFIRDLETLSATTLLLVSLTSFSIISINIQCLLSLIKWRMIVTITPLTLLLQLQLYLLSFIAKLVEFLFVFFVSISSPMIHDLTHLVDFCSHFSTKISHTKFTNDIYITIFNLVAPVLTSKHLTAFDITLSSQDILFPWLLFPELPLTSLYVLLSAFCQFILFF